MYVIIPLIILTLLISAKPVSASFQKRSVLYDVALRPASRVSQSAVIGRTLCVRFDKGLLPFSTAHWHSVTAHCYGSKV